MRCANSLALYEALFLTARWDFVLTLSDFGAESSLKIIYSNHLATTNTKFANAKLAKRSFSISEANSCGECQISHLFNLGVIVAESYNTLTCAYYRSCFSVATFFQTDISDLHFCSYLPVIQSYQFSSPRPLHAIIRWFTLDWIDRFEQDNHFNLFLIERTIHAKHMTNVGRTEHNVHGKTTTKLEINPDFC